MPENRSLYYMAPLANAPWIVLYGILSYNKVKEPHSLPLKTESIADPAVNFRRHNRCIGGFSLHDYVPLYWATHTPMQYVVTVKVKEARLRQEDLVFFVFDSEKILSLPGIVTTDGNAASDKTQFYQGRGALPAINWKIVDNPKCYSDEYKHKKCAEVLVPHAISPSLISRICVLSTEAKSKFQNELQRVAESAHIHGISIRLIEAQIAEDFYYLEELKMAELVDKIMKEIS